MERFVKIALILIISGVALCAVSAVAAGFDFSKLSTGGTPELVEESFPASDVSAISLKLETETVEISPSTDDAVHISYYTTGENDYGVELTGGVLKLSKPFTLSNIFRFDFNWDKHECKVLVPAGFSGDININASTGGVSVSGLDSLDELSVRLTTGPITIENVKAASIDLNGTTGGISVSNAVCKTARAHTSTGKITVNNLDADSITLQTNTGSVRGTLPGSIGDYTIKSHTVTGSNSLPDGQRGGNRQLDVSTTTGGIHIAFAE